MWGRTAEWSFTPGRSSPPVSCVRRWRSGPGKWAAFSSLLQAAGLQRFALRLWLDVAGRAAEEICGAGQHPNCRHLRGPAGPARPLHRHPDRPGLQLRWVSSNPSIHHPQPMELGFGLGIVSSALFPPSSPSLASRFLPSFAAEMRKSQLGHTSDQDNAEKADSCVGVDSSSVLAAKCLVGF